MNTKVNVTRTIELEYCHHEGHSFTHIDIVRRADDKADVKIYSKSSGDLIELQCKELKPIATQAGINICKYKAKVKKDSGKYFLTFFEFTLPGREYLIYTITPRKGSKAINQLMANFKKEKVLPIVALDARMLHNHSSGSGGGYNSAA